MTITQLLNQAMPEGSSEWNSLIYLLQKEYRVCESMVSVQLLMAKITGERRKIASNDIRNMFKHTFMG